MGNLNYLESGRSVKFIKIKGLRETQGPGFDEKFLPGGRNLEKLENLHQGKGGVTLGKCGMLVLCLVHYHYLRKEIAWGAWQRKFLERHYFLRLQKPFSRKVGGTCPGFLRH